MKKILFFLMLTLLCIPWATRAQSINVSPSSIETGAGGYSNTLTVTYDGYNVSDYYPSVQFYDADGITPIESGAYSWLSAYFYQGELNCGFGDNPGLARTAYFRVVLLDRNNNYNEVAYSNLVTVSQAANDCPAPDHLALTEGSLTTKGGSFTWTGYTNEYWMYIELLDGIYYELLSDNDENGRIITANFDDGIPQNFYFNNEQYPIGHFTNNGFDWSDNGGVTTYSNPNPGCIKTYSHDIGTRKLELYMSQRTYPTIISFEAMLSAGGNNKGSFWIDGIKVLEINGGEFQTKDWTQYSFELTANNEHTLKWEYTKNDDTWYGDDALFLDDIIIYKYSVVNYNYNPVHFYSNSGTLNDLGEGTYRVFVKGVCPDYNETGESNAVVFTTAPNCQVPDHLTATNVTGTSADIRWAGYGYDHFDIFRANEDLSSVDSNRVNDASSTFSGLSPNTTYKVWLKTTCETSMRGPSTRGITTITSDTLVFTTNCGAALPYFEDFENCAATSMENDHYSRLPECWNSYNETDYEWYQGYPTVLNTTVNFFGYPYSGERHLCLKSHYANGESYDYSNLYAIMPAMGTVAVNTLQLSFYACRGNDNHNNVPLYVGVMSDPTDINTFDPFETIEITGVNTSVWGDEYEGYQYHGYNQYTVDFSNYTGEGKYIAFMMEPATSSYEPKTIYIDDINCVSTAVPSSSCNITFDLVDSYGDGWNDNTIEVRDAATGELLATMANEDLDGDSQGANEHNVIPLSVNNGQEIVLLWVFDAETRCCAQECSWVITGPNGDIITQGSGSDNMQSGLELATYTVSCSTTPSPISYCQPAPTTVDGEGIINVSFGTGNNIVNNSSHPTSEPYYGDYSTQIGAVAAGTIATVDITYNTCVSSCYNYGTIIWVDWNNNGAFEDNEIVFTGQSSTSNPTGVHTLNATFAISANQATGDYRMRIGAADTYFDWYISSGEGSHDPCYSEEYAVFHDYTLRVTEAPSCIAPVVTVDHSTSTTANISWTDNNNGTPTYIIKMGNEVLSSSTTPAVSINGNSALLTGLTSEHNYATGDFTVTANCDGNDFSAAANVPGFYTGYCQPAPASVDGIGITNVSFGTGNNIVNNSSYPTSAPYYGNYTSQIGAVAVGQTATVDITFNTCYNSQSGQSCYNYGTLIWVDWNNNQAFEDNEIVFEGLSSQENNPAGVHTLNATFAVSPNRATGDYRMRIGAADSYFNDYITYGSGPHSPCYSESFAVFHDYTLRVTEATTCPPLLSLEATAQNPHTITAAWSPDQTIEPEGYVVRYGIVDNPEQYLHGVTPDGQTCVINNLCSDSLYYIHVRAYCGGDDYSEWTTVSQRTPAGSCSPITNLHVDLTGNGTNSATISWTASESTTADLYDIHVCTAPVRDLSTLENGNCEFPQATRGTSFSIPNNNYPNFVLTPNTTYYVYVRTRCNLNDGNSDWAETTFSTLPPCRQPMNASVHLIRKMLAEISWERGDANQADNYMLIFADQEMSEQTLENAQAHVSNIHDTTYSFSGNYGQTYYIYVANNCGNDGRSAYTFAGSVTFPSLCPPIQNLTASNITANTVQLSWNRGEWGEETQWNIERYLYGANSPESSIVVNDSTVIIFGLQPETNYSFRVQAQCDNTYSSIFSDFVNVTTLSAPDNCYTVANSNANASTSSFSPLYGNYCDQQQRTQSIYPASMLTELQGKTITQMKYYVSAGQNYNWRDKVFTVKLATVNEENIDTSFVYLDNSTTVYTGTLYAAMSGGMVITFNGTAPFTYQGGNLLVEFESTSEHDNHQACWFAGIERTHGSICGYGYSNYPSKTIIINDFLPKVDFCTEPSQCPAVRDLAVSDITSNSAHVSWMPGSSETMWQYICSETELSNQALQNYNWLTAYDLFVNLSNLNANTTYHVYVRPLIRGNNYCSDEIQHTSFNTISTCLPPTNVTISNITSSTATVSWEYVNGLVPESGWMMFYGTDQQFSDDTYTSISSISMGSPFVIGSLNDPLQPNTTYYVKMLSNCSTPMEHDASVWTDVYSFTTLDGPSCLEVTNLEVIGMDPDAAQITWTSHGNEEYWDLYWSTSPVAPTAQTNPTVGNTNNPRPWLAGLTPGTHYYAYVRARCSDADRSAWSAPLEFTTLEEIPSCRRVTNLEVIGMDPDAVQITWTSNGNEEYWDLYWTTSPEAPTAQTNPTVGNTNNPRPWLPELTPGTHYYAYVRARCSDADRSVWSDPLEFTIPCPVVTSFPWTENFDSYFVEHIYDRLPECWNYINTSSCAVTFPAICGMQQFSHSANNHLRLDSYIGSDPQDEYAILPRMQNISGLKIQFDARKHIPMGGTVFVGVMTDPADASTFTTIESFAPNTTEYEHYSISFENYTGSGEYIAFMMRGADPINYSLAVCIDDIIVEELPIEPHSITINQVTGGTIYVNVVDNHGNAYSSTTDTIAAYNAWVNLSVEPNAGYTFDDFVVTTASGIPIEIINSGFVMPGEDVIVSATFTQNTYTVSATVDPMNAGSVTGTGTYIYNTEVTLTAIPATGYSFDHWQNISTADNEDTETANPLSFNVTEDVTYKAFFSMIDYELIYMDGEDLFETVTYNYGDVIDPMSDPEKEGYTFTGWNPAEPATMPDSNMTLYAQWAVNSYIIYYISDEDVIRDTLAYGENITPIANPTKEGYVFVGWNPELPTTMPAHDIRAIAQWSLNKYAITYMDGDVILAHDSIAYGAAITPIANPTKEGYTFAGWNPELPQTMPANDVTVNAQWELIPCMAAENLTVTNGSLTATSALITWSSSQDNTFGGVYYENGVLAGSNDQLYQRWNLSGLQPNSNYRVGVFAYCSLNRVSDTVWVEFTTNDTCYPPVSVSISDVTAHSAKLSYAFVAQVPGDILVNLSTDPNFASCVHISTTTSDHPESLILNSYFNNAPLQPNTTYHVRMSSLCDRNADLTSVWSETLSFTTLQEYAVTIDANITNGTVTVSDTAAIEGAVVNLTATPNHGYSFGEWVVTTVNTPAPELVTVTNNSFVMPEGGVNVSATFIPNRYVITYKNGNNIQYQDSVAYGTAIIPITDPTREGYTFTGWVPELPATMPAYDVTVHAQWNINKYVLTYMDGNDMLSQDSVEFGADITPVANPTKEGYTFNGWDPEVPSTMPAHDVTVTAIFTLNTYTVTATVNPANAGTVTGAGIYNYGSEVEMRAEAADGYLFSNWTNAQGAVVSTDAIFDFEITNDTAFTANFTVMGVVATPTFSPAEGTYYDAQNVALECATTGATIHYTTDGTTPTDASAIYSTPIALTLGDTTIIKAIAMMENMTNSEMSSATYILLPTYNVTISDFTEHGTVSANVTRAAAGVTVRLTATADEGYHFGEWNVTTATSMVEVASDNSFIMPDDNVTIAATFVANEYTITYMVDNTVYDVDTFAFGTTITLVDNPTKEGYTFAGWNPELPQTMPANDMTVNAQWELIPCMAAENLAVVSGSLTATSAFITWNSSQDNTYGGVYYENGVLAGSNNQLYQRWNLVELQPGTDYRVGVFAYCSLDRISDTVWVEFTTNDTCYPPVSVSISDVTAHSALLSYDFGEHVPNDFMVYISTDPDFADFDGTSTSTDYYPNSLTLGGSGIDIQSGTTYYVRMASQCYPGLISVWSETLSFTTLQEYAVSVDADITNGTISADVTVATAGTVVNLTATPDNGYSFGEWVVTTVNTPAPELVTVTNNSFVMPEGGVNVSATFTPNSYNITVNQVTGGTITIAEAGATAGSTTNTTAKYSAWVQLTAVADNGYTFSNFVVTNADGSTIETPNNGFIMPANDVTITGYFIANEYTITYMDGNTVLDVDTFTFGTTVTPIDNPTKEGYTFTGWNPAPPATMPDNDVRTFAQWSINKYAITYMDGNEILAQDSVIYGAAITPIANPTKEGYTFEGWDPELPQTMPANDVTVNAQWELIPCMAAENLAVANGSLTATSALITWSSSQDNTFGGVYYENGVLAGSNDQLYLRWNLSDLQPNSNYRVGVFAYCSFDRVSDTVWVEFSTNDTCYPPVSVSISDVTAHSALLSYDFGEQVPGDFIVYIATNQDFDNYIPISTSTDPDYFPTSLPLSSLIGLDLQSGTTYYVKMSSFCSINPELVSVWSETISFTTLEEYTVTIDDNIANGTVTADVTVAAAGTVVNLTATPDNGYSFGEWVVTTVNTPAPELVTVTNNSFVMPEGGVNVSATFTPNSYNITVYQMTGGTITVTVGANDTSTGTSTTTSTTAEFESWVQLSVTTNEGFSFVDFLVTDEEGEIIETPNNGFIMPAGDVVVTALFSVNDYTVTYMDGNYMLAQDTFAFGATITPIDDPTREGYTFTGWSPALPTNMPAEDLFVNAQWQINSYNVTVSQVAGGTFTVTINNAGVTTSTSTDTTANYNNWIQLSYTTYDGYTFNGFVVTTADGTFIETPNNGFVMPANDVTITANFTANDYTITYMDGNNMLAQDTFAFGATITPITNPTREGYTFMGWNPALPTTMPAEDLFVNAQWQANSYKVTINQATGGVVMIILEGAAVGTTIGDSVQYNSWVRLDALTFDGYTFGDFVVTTASGNTIEVTNNGSYNGFMMPAEDVTVTATFSVNNYTITYMDGNSILAQDTFAFGAAITPIDNPTREGYTFMGWNPALPTTMPAEDLFVNAQWQINSYNIAIEQVAGGTITVSFAGELATSLISTTTDTSANFETWIQLSADADLGYNFVDFLVTTVSGDTLETPNNGFIMPAENVTVTAIFSINNYTITYMDGNNMLAQDTFAFGATITPIANPTREGYTFMGWNPALPTTMPAEDLFVNAQWQINSYNIAIEQVTGGTITVSFAGESATSYVSTTTDTSANFETWIQLSADADYAYDFVDFVVTTASGDTLETPNNGFIMPAENVTVTAIFTLHYFNVTVNVSDETPWGTVTGSGSFVYGSTDTLTATANDQYIFVGWSDFNTENPRVITVTSDTVLTAFFVPEEIEIISDDTLTGSVSIHIPGGHLSPNSPIVITAVPEPHYHFVSWSDGNTDNPRTILPIQAVGLTAIFAIDQHTVTVLSNDDNMGTVDGNVTADYGTVIQISATAYDGYAFVSWNDGNTENPRYITVESDTTFVATFQLVDGIEDVNMSNVNVYSYNNQVVIANAEGFSVEIFDMSGRLVVSENSISQSVCRYTISTDGIYLVKVGKNLYKKVKIAR